MNHNYCFKTIGQSVKNELPSRRSGMPNVIQGLARRLLRYLAINENVNAGRDLRVGRGVVISSPHGLTIGDKVAIGPRTTIQVNGSIGNFTLIGMSVQICGRHDHATDEVGRPISESTWVGDRDPCPHDSVNIGTDVWIGGHSTILSGVTIGDGSIIGAGSIVTRDIPEFSIAVGAPARVIGQRFSSVEERDKHLLLLGASAPRSASLSPRSH